MPYPTTRKKPKATTKPWYSRLLRHSARKRSGSILVHNTHLGPTRGLDREFEYQILLILKILGLTRQKGTFNSTN